ncbi:MAG: phosphoribosylanthranilate isomerase [Sphingobium sp.]
MSRIATKICGLTTPRALDAAIGAGASHVGFVFFGKSPRNIDPAQAGALVSRSGGKAQAVGLFVDPDPDYVREVRALAGLDIIQLHGAESPALVSQIARMTGRDVWKAIPVRTKADLAQVHQYRGAATLALYDAKPPVSADLPGGNGIRFDWKLLDGLVHPLEWGLSGGLGPDNVAEAIRITRAPLVDVSSGVESVPGIKDVDKIAAFCKAVGSL